MSPDLGQVRQALDRSIEETAAQPGLAAFRQALVQARHDLDQPMRIALAGKIKAGKSTLMNALLGADVAARGATETTFNVNWFQYADEPAAVVAFRDGRREPRDFGQLRELTVRDASKGDFLRSIRHVEIGYPNPILRHFNLIDTPGLDSVYETDARNTMDLLGISGKEVEDWSIEHASQADAIVYMFSKTPTEYDLSVMDRFRGGVSQMDPVNAIGVLTRVDDYFPDEQEPVRCAEEIIARLKARHSALDRVFYLIQPVCGLLALGAQTLTDAEFQLLGAIAQQPAELVDRVVWGADEEKFRNSAFGKVPGLPGPGERGALAERLGFYGCKLAVDAIRRGQDLPATRAELMERSGVETVREKVISHFGNRALLIKLYRHITFLIDVVGFREYQKTTGPERAAVSAIRARLAGIRAASHGFNELEVLKRLYAGATGLNADEVVWMLQVTGEYGLDAHQRLGLPKDASRDEMKALAETRMLHFRTKSQHAFLIDRANQESARILEDSFGYLLADLSSTKQPRTPRRRSVNSR